MKSNNYTFVKAPLCAQDVQVVALEVVATAVKLDVPQVVKQLVRLIA